MGWVSGLAQASGESYVIGRITGTFQHLPGYFYQNQDFLSSGEIDEVEFPGFRLLRVEDGKKFLIRPNHKGYFYQELPGGEYTLTRKRNDKPDYRQPKTIDIMHFEVKGGYLVNLGTIHIVLEGEPVESLFHLRDTARGKYIFSYRYERDHAENTYSQPLSWFHGRKKDIAAALGGRVIQVEATPTSEKDGSKVVLRENGRFHD